MNTGNFYIGCSVNKYKWDRGYPGSGRLWRSYYEKYKNLHEFERIILKDDFKTPKEMYDYEVDRIKEYFEYDNKNNKYIKTNELCMNLKTAHQHSYEYNIICSECGSLNGQHKKSCSKYNRKEKECLECHAKSGNHLKTCSKYKAPNPCTECGSTYQHKSWCSKHKQKRKIKPCSECGGLEKHHKKGCSKYKGNNKCSECGRAGGFHLKTCSKYKVKELCNKSKNCKARVHKKGCPKYKIKSVCNECGGLRGNHKKTCSRYPNTIACKECGVINGHKKYCSKAKYCKECGSVNGHLKTCSKFKEKVACSECGSKSYHKSWCSKSAKNRK